ncbi:hypothetical protein [Planctobacterium marinum]|uniref:Uncharacterized protein n=1 Tax=Planctobacterium marinum TaxID=1631968 RepID=A0AA48HJV4_9ALTE|nr:hypothetical protein MACH26_04330 [Planctobacterium marinum]
MKRLITLFLCCFSFKLYSVEMSAQEYQAAVEDIQQILQSGNTRSLNLLSAELEDDVLVVRPPNPRQGEIWLHWPVTNNALRVLQVPHGSFDLHTREIGELWFYSDANLIPRPDIIMFNTEHRYETEQSDLSRLASSLFTAAADAFSKMQRPISIVQIHGFNPARRKSDSGASSDIILSNGSLYPDPGTVTRQSCLRDNGSLLARAYGRDVFELGATINPVGKLLRAQKEHQVSFLHIEMAFNLRKALLAQAIPSEAIACLLD